MVKLHGDRADALLDRRFPEGQTWKVADLFEDSPYRYQSLDLYPGKSIIQADLNIYSVPQEYRGAFDLVANLGSTEHIFDQVNAFRCMHDFVKPGGIFWHAVPSIGYYNHSLYNYHPLFFVFLARANNYKIENASLSPPGTEFTVPKYEPLAGTEAWKGVRLFGGVVCFVLRKTSDQPFQLFSDYDQDVMGRPLQEDEWTAMMRDRYDLHVRE